MNKQDLIKDKMTARKDGQHEKVLALDAVISEIDLIESRNNKTLTEDEIMSTLKKVVSQLQETADMYTKGGKSFEAGTQLDRINILSEYLPVQLDESQLRSSIALAIAAENAQSMRDMGKVIKRLKEHFGASLDMALTSEIVKRELS